MADTFGLQFDGLRDKLEQAGGYYEVTLYAGIEAPATSGAIYINGLDSEKSGIPVPPDCAIFIEIYYAVKQGTAAEGGVKRIFAHRAGSGNVTLGDLVGGTGASTVEVLSTNAAATVPNFLIQPTADTTNQAVALNLSDEALTGTTFSFSGHARISCVKNGQLLPPYSGGATANSPFGVS